MVNHGDEIEHIIKLKDFIDFIIKKSVLKGFNLTSILL
jgi:hypothetical protein